MRGAPVLAFAILLLALAPPAQAANFGVHTGLADDLWDHPHFRAGALLADLDHFLPPTEPQTDDLPFALGVVKRAYVGSLDAWAFATGWYEHLDQDARFAAARARILAAYPSYTDADVRLAFDALALRKHPFPEDYDWVLADDEVLRIVQGGLVGTDLAGVRAAVDALLHSTDLANPGLALQLSAARTYASVFPGRVASMEAEYDRYHALVTRSFDLLIMRLPVDLRGMASIVRRFASDGEAVLPHLRAAIALEATRPANWTVLVVAELGAFVNALPYAGLPDFLVRSLALRAAKIVALLT